MPTKCFAIREIPDPRFGPFRATAGGDVRQGCFGSAEHVLRVLADMPVECDGFLELRMRYVPTDDPRSLQNRFHIHLTVGAAAESDLQSLMTAFWYGPLSRFYSFELDASVQPKLERGVSCDVVRRARVTRPFVPPDRNPHVPEYYFSVDPFVPEEENDYQMLDRVLSGLSEPVEISLAVAPFDSSRLIDAHAAYLQQIESINRPWSDEESGTTIDEDYFSESETWPIRSNRPCLKPFRHRDPLADEQLRRHRRFQEVMHEPYLVFHLRVMAVTPAVARLVASVLGDSVFRNGSFALVMRPMDKAQIAANRVIACPAELTLPHYVDISSFADLLPMVHTAPVSELTAALRLPVSGVASPCCIRRNTDPGPQPKSVACVVFGRDLEVWTPDHRVGLDQLLPMEALAKHVFVSGLPGSGKTTFAIDLLIQLREKGIPFIVFETAKREFRAIKRFQSHPDPRIRSLAESLQIFTLGAEDLSPFRFNPLEPVAGVSAEEHVEHQMTMFHASMPLTGPMPALLREGLLELMGSRDDHEPPPVLADLRDVVERCAAAKRYSAETNADIRAALDVRLGLLTEGLTGRVFQSPLSTPTVEQLVTGCTVVELDRLPQEAKCVNYFGLTKAITRHLRNTPYDGGIRLVIITEESHNVIGVSTEARASEDAADPRAFAAEAAVTALAEDRAIGIGHVILDQLPSSVAPQVVKNTGTKIAFRQVAVDDRDVLGGAMLCDDTEQEELARLTVGEAYFFTEGYFRPRRIRTLNLHGLMPELARPCGDAELAQLIEHSSWRKAAEIRRRSAELNRLSQVLNRFDALRGEVGRRVFEIGAQNGQEQSSSQRNERAIGQVIRLRSLVELRFLAIRRTVVARLLGTTVPIDPALQEWWEAIRRRWTEVVSHDTRKWLVRINQKIKSYFASREAGRQ